MAKLDSESVDVICCSPPYNIGAPYNTYKDRLASLEYIRFTTEWMKEVCRLLKPDGSFFLNIGSSSKDPTLPFHVVMCATASLHVIPGFHLQNAFHWIKSISLHGQSFGHFKPINSSRYVNDCHEYVFHFTKNGDVRLNRLAIGVPYKDKSNIKRWSHTGGKRDLRCRGNTWFIPYETRQEKKSHPCTFPVQLPLNCILIHGRENCTVLDPFVGTGASAIAALKSRLVSKFIGFDIDRSYIQEAAHSIQELASNENLK